MGSARQQVFGTLLCLSNILSFEKGAGIFFLILLGDTEEKRRGRGYGRGGCEDRRGLSGDLIDLWSVFVESRVGEEFWSY